MGFHDWEILETSHQWKLRKYADENFLNVKFDGYTDDDIYLDKKICIRPNCNKKIDEIGQFLKKYIEDKIQKNKRKKIANDIHVLNKK